MSKNTLKFLILTGLLVAFFTTLLITQPVSGRPPLGVTNFDSIHLRDSGPTAQPVLRADQRGAGKIVEFMDAGTPVWSINDGGSITQSGLQSLTGGQVVSPNLVVQGPLAKGTATPGLTIIEPSTQGSQALAIKGNATATPYLELNATRALYINNALQYGTVGSKEVCGTSSITASATVVHTLATPVVATCSIAGDPTGSQFCSYTNAAGVVTVKVWQEVASTPVANAAAVTTGWCVKGTP